jgi:hypothetical protein
LEAFGQTGGFDVFAFADLEASEEELQLIRDRVLLLAVLGRVEPPAKQLLSYFTGHIKSLQKTVHVARSALVRETCESPGFLLLFFRCCSLQHEFEVDFTLPFRHCLIVPIGPGAIKTETSAFRYILEK